jgi:hypothetical protein
MKTLIPAKNLRLAPAYFCFDQTFAASIPNRLQQHAHDVAES